MVITSPKIFWTLTHNHRHMVHHAIPCVVELANLKWIICHFPLQRNAEEKQLSLSFLPVKLESYGTLQISRTSIQCMMGLGSYHWLDNLTAKHNAFTGYLECSSYIREVGGTTANDKYFAISSVPAKAVCCELGPALWKTDSTDFV